MLCSVELHEKCFIASRPDMSEKLGLGRKASTPTNPKTSVLRTAIFIYLHSSRIVCEESHGLHAYILHRKIKDTCLIEFALFSSNQIHQSVQCAPFASALMYKSSHIFFLKRILLRATL